MQSLIYIRLSLAIAQTRAIDVLKLEGLREFEAVESHYAALDEDL